MLYAVLGLTLLCLGLGVWEKAAARRASGSIPIRILVNGTRGKSSVTRLVAAGLRGAGVRTFAKATGSKAVVILPDGTEVPVMRRGRARITEMGWFMRMAAREGAAAVVVECMAVEPECQIACADHYVLPVITLITNVRLDHTEVMGPAYEDIARVLALSVPRKSLCLLGDSEIDRGALAVLRDAVENRGCTLKVVADPPADSPQTEGYFEFAQNIHLAVEALRTVLDSPARLQLALRAIRETAPDVGALWIKSLSLPGVPAETVRFANGFAANDVESARQMIDRVSQNTSVPAGGMIGLLNLRRDRAQRTRDWLAAACDGRLSLAGWVICGSLTAGQRRALSRNGVCFATVNAEASKALLEALSMSRRACPESPVVIVGLGNIAGAGHRVLDFIEQQHEQGVGATPCS